MLDFIIAILNHYFYSLEALTAQTQNDHNEFLIMTSEDQISYEQMTIALIYIVILFFDDMTFKIKFEFWLNEFYVRQQFHDIIVVDDAENDDSRTTRRIKRLSLKLKNCIRQNDIAFFSTNMIVWKNLFVFKSHFQKRLHFIQDDLQNRFLKNSIILIDVQCENCLLAHFCQMTCAIDFLNANWTFKIRDENYFVIIILYIVIELIIQNYMLQIFHLLQSRFTRDMTKAVKIIIIVEFMTFFDNDERAKLMNFSHSMIFRLFRFKSHVIIVHRFFVI